MLLAIVGEVGSGKSSLLQAILGEMKNNGDNAVEVNGAVTYAAQTAYIFNATVRDNITFGRKFDRDVYESVLDACCLRPDLGILQKGDTTEIGEQGINLSGGRKVTSNLIGCNLWV